MNRMLRSRQPLGGLLVLLIAIQPAIRATASDSSEKADYLLAGWRSEREKLTSGVFQLSGLATDAHGQSKIEVSCTFDHSIASRKYKVYWEGNYDGWWLATPEVLAQCVNNPAPVVDIINPTDPTLPFVREFDPRCFGVTYASDLSEGVTFEHVVQRMLAPGLQDVKSVADGIYELTWHRGNSQLKSLSTVRINERKGFSVERFELRTQVPSNGGRENPWYFATGSDLSWAQHNGLWVPVAIKTRGLGKQAVELKISWDQVNSAIPADEFTVEKLGVPRGGLVSDRRLSLRSPILVGRIGRGDSDPPRSTGTALRLRTLIVAANAVVALLVLWFLRKRLSGSSTVA